MFHVTKAQQLQDATGASGGLSFLSVALAHGDCLRSRHGFCAAEPHVLYQDKQNPAGFRPLRELSQNAPAASPAPIGWRGMSHDYCFVVVPSRMEAVLTEKMDVNEEPALCQDTCDLPWHSLCSVGTTLGASYSDPRH